MSTQVVSRDRIPDDWMAQLADTIARTIQAFAPRLDRNIVSLLAIDCHPWHGFIGLSVLTHAEIVANPCLDDPAEMAAWLHYDFGRDLKEWQPSAELGRVMRDVYQAESQPALADAFLQTCASALRANQVIDALRLVNCSANFRLSVAHPDDQREFVEPERRTA